MRVMVIVKANQKTEAGVLPTEAELAAMGKYNAELLKAGIMLAGDGIHPSSRGVRVRFPDKKVIDGPFTETKELVAGYWIWQVKSLEEAIEWLKRAPFSAEGGEQLEIEIRPMFEICDFAMSDETRDRFEAQNARVGVQKK
jgi:hypothetical protein